MEKLRNISVVDPARCTGCGACAQTCPTVAITMKLDEEGFLAPVINQEVCVNCGVCKKVWSHTLEAPRCQRQRGGRGVRRVPSGI